MNAVVREGGRTVEERSGKRKVRKAEVEKGRMEERRY